MRRSKELGCSSSPDRELEFRSVAVAAGFLVRFILCFLLVACFAWYTEGSMRRATMPLVLGRRARKLRQGLLKGLVSRLVRLLVIRICLIVCLRGGRTSPSIRCHCGSIAVGRSLAPYDFTLIETEGLVLSHLP